MSAPDLSIVVPTRNEGRNVVDTVESLLRNTTSDFEVLVVDDGSTDYSPGHLRRIAAADGRLRVVCGGGLGPARSRNRGAREARGRYLAFMDGHCYAPPGWLEPLMEVLKSRPDVAMVGPAISDTNNVRMRGCGGTWHDDSLDMSWLPDRFMVTEVPFQPAGCQVVRREVFEAVGGYDEGLTGWGSEDVEFSIRLWLFGYTVCVQPTSEIFHYFRTQPPYEMDIPQVVYNKLRMSFLHFDGERLSRVLRYQLQCPFVAAALARVHSDGTRDRGEAFRNRRVRDMDWFCERFGLLA